MRRPTGAIRFTGAGITEPSRRGAREEGCSKDPAARGMVSSSTGISSLKPSSKNGKRQSHSRWHLPKLIDAATSTVIDPKKRERAGSNIAPGPLTMGKTFD